MAMFNYGMVIGFYCDRKSDCMYITISLACDVCGHGWIIEISGFLYFLNILSFDAVC